jgi:uncharacterized protein YjbI with pentapeptide repeats
MKKYQIRPLTLLQLCILGQTGAFAADFSDADLRGAHLTNADLRGSKLSGANLAGADLSRTDLRETNVTQQQLDSACGFETKLPAGLRIKPCTPSTASGPDINGTDQRTSIDQAHNDDRGFFGILVEVLPMKKKQASPQPPERVEVSSELGK